MSNPDSNRATIPMLRAAKSALMDAHPDIKSAHLSEMLAALFGHRTSKALKDGLERGEVSSRFHDGDACLRLVSITGCSPEVAQACVVVARGAAIEVRKQESAQRGLARRQAEAARNAPRPGRYADINGGLVGFVVKTRHGTYKPFVGRVMDEPESRDAMVYVVGSQDVQDSMELALAFYAPDREHYAMVLEHPVCSGGMMGHWLNHMLGQQQVEPDPLPGPAI